MNRRLFTLFTLLSIMLVTVVVYTVVARTRANHNNAQPTFASASSSADAGGVVGATNNFGEDVSATARDVFISARNAKQAPAIFEGGTWVNSEPLALEALRGRVVLVDFWTFGCSNCRNTLPTLKRFDASFRDQGLTIIGVQTPEFDSEKRIENVRREVQHLGIKYPVVVDNEGATWRAYDTQAWPTVFILDKQGRIRYTHIGEGAYDVQEKIIKALLLEEIKGASSNTRDGSSLNENTSSSDAK